jgi:hypothetical protein
LKRNYLFQTVDEFRREFPARRRQSAASDLSGQIPICRAREAGRMRRTRTLG